MRTRFPGVLAALGAALVAFCLSAQVAGANGVRTACLNFDLTAPVTGRIAYATRGGPLVGTNISVNSITGVGTLLNDSVTFPCVGCYLSFTTGNLVSTTPTTWTFGPGGTIQLIGGVDLDNSGTLGPNDIPAGTILFSGFFTDDTTIAKFGSSFAIVETAFTDNKSLDLTNVFGFVSTLTYEGGLNLSFSNAHAPPGTFVSNLLFGGNASNCAGLLAVGMGQDLPGRSYNTSRCPRRG